MQRRIEQYLKRAALREKIAAFLADEKVAGVILPSRDGKNSGGSGGTFLTTTAPRSARNLIKRTRPSGSSRRHRH